MIVPNPTFTLSRRSLVLGGALLGGSAVAGSFLQMGTAGDYEHYSAGLRAPMRGGDIRRELVRYATLAANGHNSQPWRFRISDGSIAILPDVSRRTPAVDPDDHHLYTSLGCAAENLAVAAAAMGLVGTPRFDPGNGGAVIFDYRAGKPARSALCDAIPRRQSTRSEFERRSAPAADLRTLQEAAERDGVALFLLTGRSQLARMAELVVAGNAAQMADPAFMAELKQWMRFNRAAAINRGDGLFAGSSGAPSLPDWVGRPMFDLFFRADAENRKYARQIDHSSGVAVFLGARADPESWVNVGRACQRFSLQATALGMKLSFINQPVEVAALRPELAAMLKVPGRRPDIVMRYGYGPAMPMSPRRPVKAVIEA